MKKFLLFLFSILLLTQLIACQSTEAPPLSQNDQGNTDAWVLIHEIPEDQVSIYIRHNSIGEHPENAQWRAFKLQLNMPAAIPPSSEADYTFDCSNQAYRLERVTFYSEEHLQGELIETLVAPENLPFSPMSPDSYIKTAVFPTVCEGNLKNNKMLSSFPK